MKFRATIERLWGGTALRTPFVSGIASPPVAGESFSLLGRGLTLGMPYRMVVTAPVVSIKKTLHDDYHAYILRTESGSIYKVTLHGAPVMESEIDGLLR